MLNENRYFDANLEVRKIASELYAEVKNLPIFSPHGHVDPKIFAENKPFPDPAELFIIPDHYIFRMLYSQGYRFNIETNFLENIDIIATMIITNENRNCFVISIVIQIHF